MFKSAAMISALSLALVFGTGTAEASEQQVQVGRSEDGDKPSTGLAQEADQRVESALKTRLMALGLTSTEAEARIAALTPGDLQKLAQNPEQVAMAGIKDTTLILIAVILVVPSLILLLMI